MGTGPCSGSARPSHTHRTGLDGQDLIDIHPTVVPDKACFGGRLWSTLLDQITLAASHGEPARPAGRLPCRLGVDQGGDGRVAAQPIEATAADRPDAPDRDA